MQALARDAPRLRCELVEAEPEHALPALALGDVDLVLGDEWQHQPRRLPEGLQRHDLLVDPVLLVLPPRHPIARRHPEAVPLAALAGEAWTAGHAEMGWEEMTQRTCRELGGFDPDIRHRANDATISLALVARGLAVSMLPELPLRGPAPGRRAAHDRRGPGRSGDLRRHARRGRRAPLDAGARRRGARRRRRPARRRRVVSRPPARA